MMERQLNKLISLQDDFFPVRVLFTFDGAHVLFIVASFFPPVSHCHFPNMFISDWLK